MRVAINRIQAKLRYSWVAFQLLSDQFTLSELRAAYAAILDPSLVRLNTSNFKGPVAFFLPNFWSHGSVREPRLAGQLLDSRPVDPNRAVQMETQYIPAVQSVANSRRERVVDCGMTQGTLNSD